MTKMRQLVLAATIAGIFACLIAYVRRSPNLRPILSPAKDRMDDTLRQELAVGPISAVHIDPPVSDVEALAVGNAIIAAIRAEDADAYLQWQKTAPE